MWVLCNSMGWVKVKDMTYNQNDVSWRVMTWIMTCHGAPMNTENTNIYISYQLNYLAFSSLFNGLLNTGTWTRLDCKYVNNLCCCESNESLFLEFLKEDLFYFFQIIFQDFLFFIYLYRIVLFLADMSFISEKTIWFRL